MISLPHIFANRCGEMSVDITTYQALQSALENFYTKRDRRPGNAVLDPENLLILKMYVYGKHFSLRSSTRYIWVIE